MMRLKIIFIFAVLLFTFSVQTVFAADVQVSGKILDTNENPVPQGVVVFVDASGKTVGAATTDMSGLYQTSLPAGTYTVSVEGPKGSGLQKIEMPNSVITSATEFNFTLTAPTTSVAKKPTVLARFMPYILGLAAVLVVGLIIMYFLRKKRSASLPESRSSD